MSRSLLVPANSPRLVELVAPDGRELQGLVHEPVAGSATAALLHLHGKGGNCYSGPSRFLPRLLADHPCVHLALNMRCHDLGYTRYDVEDSGELRDDGGSVDGGFWERLEEGRLDVEAGVRWLAEHTGLPIFVVAHSAGGFYLADHSPSAPSLAGRVLLSPLTTTSNPLAAWFGSDHVLAEVARQAREMVRSDRGHHLIPVPRWFFAISAASLVERLDERPDRWIDGMNRSTAPVLLMWGARESRAALWRSLFERLVTEDKTLVELPGTGHAYQGSEQLLADHVAQFVRTRARGALADADMG